MKKLKPNLLVVLGLFLLGLTITSCEDTGGNTSSNTSSDSTDCPDDPTRCEARNY